MDASLRVSHEGEVTQLDVEVLGERTYPEEARSGDAQSTIVWSLVAAALGGVALLAGFTVWRRRGA